MREPAEIVHELERHAHLRDFAIPQRGALVVGRAFFTDAPA